MVIGCPQARSGDFDAGRVTFAGEVVDGDAGVVAKGTKTDRIYRATANTETMAALSAHRERCERRAEACGVLLGQAGFVFSFEPNASEP